MNFTFFVDPTAVLLTFEFMTAKGRETFLVISPHNLTAGGRLRGITGEWGEGGMRKGWRAKTIH